MFYTRSSLMKFKFFALHGDGLKALLGSTAVLKTREGFFMDAIPNSPRRRTPDFSQIVRSFLGGDGLPFAEVLSADRIREIFAKHNNQFGGIYSTAVMVWSFLGQVLRDGKEASCQAAVARIVSFCLQSGRAAPTADTGDDCRARAKLSEHALHS